MVKAPWFGHKKNEKNAGQLDLSWDIFFEALDVTGIPVLCGKSLISTSEKLGAIARTI
jgi:hypothetical protein